MKNIFLKPERNLHKTLFLLIIVAGIFLRFNNLNWGAPFYFQPDERQNIAYPILESSSRLLRDQKNFDINPFPLIVIKNTFHLTQYLPTFKTVDPTGLIIIISRIYSALFSLLISICIFYICKKIWNDFVANIAFILSVFSTGFIQYAHFGTIELWESFIFLILFFLSYEIIKGKENIYFLPLGIIFSIGVSTKFLVVSFLPIILITFFPFIIAVIKNKKRKNIMDLFKAFYFFLMGSTTTILIFFPQLLFNFDQIFQSLKFESSVATGSLSVFYTQGFTNSIPIFYQLKNIFPFLLNPVIFILWIISFIYGVLIIIKKREFSFILLIISFLIPFVYYSFLFVKWTRYMVPILPFIYIMVSLFIYFIYKKNKNNYHKLGIFLLPIVCSVLFSIAFVFTVYFHPHTTIAASLFLKDKIKPSSQAIGEPFDIGITPFNPYISRIELINFYDLDNDKNILQQLNTNLDKSDFIILSSQRIVKSRLQNPKNFPEGYKFYKSLITPSKNFKLIYKTPCNILCQITYLGDPTFKTEETVTVFDRPTVMIFQHEN